MPTQIFDDGSTLSYDLFGNITGATDTYGTVVPVGGDVAARSQVDGAISRAINRVVDALLPVPEVNTSVYRQAAPAAPFNVGSVLGPVAIVGGGALLFRLLSKK